MYTKRIREDIIMKYFWPLMKDIITDEEDEIEEMMRHVDGTGE